MGARAGNPFKTGSGSLLPPTVQVPTLGNLQNTSELGFLLSAHILLPTCFCATASVNSGSPSIVATSNQPSFSLVLRVGHHHSLMDSNRPPSCAAGHTSPQHSPTPASFAVTPMLTSSNPSPDGTPVGRAAQGLSFGGGSHGFDPFQLSSQPAASPFGTDAAQEQRQQTRSPRAAGLYDNRFADLTPLSPQSAHQRPPVTSSALPMRTSSSNRSGAW